uniref:Uncharacterized protein n=1 Tax=Sus scrofa TaxID=9823 RepID=A0A8D0M960_PIG
VESDFYLCYHVGHKGKFSHEFLYFEFPDGKLRYANNGNYKNDVMSRKELEIIIAEEYTSLTTKIGSLIDVNQFKDPEGLQVFDYLLQELKCLIFSLTGLYLKIKSI